MISVTDADVFAIGVTIASAAPLVAGLRSHLKPR